MDFTDSVLLLFALVVLWLAIELNGGGGGGLRDRIPARIRI
jgi:hypothetical protein